MTHKNDKVLSLRDVVLYTISAILLVDQIAMSAAVGPLAIFWWIVILLFFFIPNTLVTAELGATYPEQGGIYAWVKTAFGARWGARVTWLYWINIVLWMPSVFIMFSGIFTVLYMPEMTLWSQIILCVLLCWVVVFINCIDLNKSKWIPNVGTPIKFVIFLVLGGFGINYGIENGFANDVNVLNGFSDLAEGLAFIPVIVYGCLGVELICSESKRIKNPSGNVPKAMIIAGLLTGGLYIFATLGVLAAVPLEDIEITEILATTLSELFGGSVIGHAFALIIGGMTLFTFFSTIVAWTIGGNRAVAEAGQEKEMPAVFGITNKRTDAPKGAAIMTGMVSTVTLLLYGCMANSAEELFWTLFSFSAIIFLMPYIAMHCAFLKLRTINTTVNRPFKVPGGQNIGTLFALICISTLALAILLFFWVPGEPLDMTLLAQVGSGVLFTLVFGEFLIRRGEAYKN